MKAGGKKRRWMRYSGHWYSNLYLIAATLLQVPDGVMVAYESQSEEEEMDDICGALRCLQPVYIGNTLAGA
jgi:hypothetical protein